MAKKSSKEHRKVKMARNEPLPATPRPETDGRRLMRRNADLVFSDGLMIFLAAMMIPIIIFPILFNLHSQIVDFLRVTDIFILAIFVVEYFTKLYLAKDRLAHFKNPWHLLDLVIILLPLLELVPFFIPFNPKYSPIFRLLRVLRLFAVGGRSVERRTHILDANVKACSASSKLKARVMAGTMDNIKDGLTLEEVKSYLHDNEQTWIDITDICDVDLEKLSDTLGLPEPLLASKLVEEAYPRIDTIEGSAYIYLQFRHLKPLEEGRQTISIGTSGQLIICHGMDIITLSRSDNKLFEKVIEELRKKSGYGDSLLVTALNGILDVIIETYKDITTELEHELLRLEGMPRDEMPQDFLENSFQLKKEVTRFVASLLHLKEVVSEITSNRAPLEGFDKTWKGMFDIHLDDTEYLLETAQNSKENLISLIELHINITSHETNKVMRVIAVITVLALIPTMITGMLGMNVLGVPFAAYVWQLATITGMFMALGAWAFYKIGWLRMA